jgi:transposase
LEKVKNQTKTAALLRVSFDQVNRVLYRGVARGLKRRSKRLEYQHISIDEKSIGKGHNYLSILSDEQTGVVIGAVQGRRKVSVDGLCSKWMTKSQRSKVKTVCTDMWDAYIYGAKHYFKNAKHCHDHFHIVGYLNKAVDKVRKREVKRQEALKGTKYIFLKDHDKLTEEQRVKFDQISKVNYEVARAWQIKENFRDIQFKQTPQKAFRLFMRWRQNANNSKIPEIIEVVEMFDRHMVGIINAIECGSTNARAERINGAIQELKTIGRGYANPNNFINAILFFHGDLDVFPH